MYVTLVVLGVIMSCLIEAVKMFSLNLLHFDLCTITISSFSATLFIALGLVYARHDLKVLDMTHYEAQIGEKLNTYVNGSFEHWRAFLQKARKHHFPLYFVLALARYFPFNIPWFALVFLTYYSFFDQSYYHAVNVFSIASWLLLFLNIFLVLFELWALTLILSKERQIKKRKTQ